MSTRGNKRIPHHVDLQIRVLKDDVPVAIPGTTPSWLHFDRAISRYSVSALVEWKEVLPGEVSEIPTDADITVIILLVCWNPPRNVVVKITHDVTNICFGVQIVILLYYTLSILMVNVARLPCFCKTRLEVIQVIANVIVIFTRSD